MSYSILYAQFKELLSRCVKEFGAEIVGDLLVVSKSTISRWVRGKHLPRSRILPAAVKALKKKLGK